MDRQWWGSTPYDLLSNPIDREYPGHLGSNAFRLQRKLQKFNFLGLLHSCAKKEAPSILSALHRGGQNFALRACDSATIPVERVRSRCLDNNKPIDASSKNRHHIQFNNNPTPTECLRGGNRNLCAWSSYFEKQISVCRKRTRGQRTSESRAQIEGKKTRPTTCEEYIRACHTLLSKPLSIQRDKSLSTQGSITSPKNKPCPTLLKPWTDFPVLQQQLFERIYEYIPRDAELFSSTQYLTELGQDLCDRPLASEKDLEAYQHLAVETDNAHHLPPSAGRRGSP